MQMWADTDISFIGDAAPDRVRLRLLVLGEVNARMTLIANRTENILVEAEDAPMVVECFLCLPARFTKVQLCARGGLWLRCVRLRMRGKGWRHATFGNAGVNGRGQRIPLDAVSQKQYLASVRRAAVARAGVRCRVWRRDVLDYVVGHGEVTGKAIPQFCIALELNMLPMFCKFIDKLAKER